VSWVGSVSESEAPPSRSGYVLGTFVFVDVGSCAVLDYEDTRLRDVVAIAADYTLLDPLNVTVADRTCESTGRRRQTGGYQVTLKLRFVATLENLAWVSRLVASLTQEAGLGSLVSRFTLALDASETTSDFVVQVSPSLPRIDCGAPWTETTNWTVWSACSIECGPAPGIQFRSRTCPPESETRSCAVPVCHSCTVDNGGCAAVATCTAPVAAGASVTCACPTQLIGDGRVCLNRTVEQSNVLRGDLFFDVSLLFLANTPAAQVELQEAIRLALAAHVPLAVGRVRSTGVYPMNNTRFRYAFVVDPPIAPTELTAAQAASAMQSNYLSLVVSHGGNTFLPTDIALLILTDALSAAPTRAPTAQPTRSPTAAPTARPTRPPTLSPTATPTRAPTASPTAAPTTNSPTKAPTSSPTTFDDFNANNNLGSANDSTASGSGWGKQDTRNLLIALLVTVAVLLIVFQALYIRRKRQNMLLAFSNERGFNPVRANSNWWASAADGDDPNGRTTGGAGGFDNKHYYPQGAGTGSVQAWSERSPSPDKF
jgi:hypothetical protein